jgi:aspartyl-tRNA synthetase
MADWQRTHTCGELREEHIGQTVTLNGWVHVARAQAHQVFADLRDRYGLTQVVFEADDADLFANANRLRSEWCVSVTGVVSARLRGAERDIPTGKVEVKATSLRVLNECPTPKFPVTEFPGEELANEDLRLQWRFLDLRRGTLQRTLALRHRLNKVIRDFLDAERFLELETPLLGRSTPEGARDYLVPSRVHPGSWYALPQSPQLYKQLLMVAGYDRYAQIARCLRDEDLRADRQPEFTQLDLEMSFVEQEDVLTLVERLTARIFEECIGVRVPLPLPRLQFHDAMRRYGSDKPDLRFGLEIVDVGEIVAASEFGVFRNALAAGGVVRGINVKGGADKFSNTDLKPGGSLPAFVAVYKAKGLAWMKVEADKLTGSIEKFFPAGVQAALRRQMGAEPGDLLVFVADNETVVCDALGALRTHLAERLKLIDPAKREFCFAWVLDFPSFMYDDEEKRWVANHHPFTAPKDEDLPKLETDPGAVRAKAYDLVCNGYEVGGGSIRIHDPSVQQRVFSVLGMPPEQAEERFGFLLHALKHGAPPHGGIALGLDRWSMLLAGTANIRDVIAFPKNQRAQDRMTGAPAPVEKRQLKELGIQQ